MIETRMGLKGESGKRAGEIMQLIKTDAGKWGTDLTTLHDDSRKAIEDEDTGKFVSGEWGGLLIREPITSGAFMGSGGLKDRLKVFDTGKRETGAQHDKRKTGCNSQIGGRKDGPIDSLVLEEPESKQNFENRRYRGRSPTLSPGIRLAKRITHQRSFFKLRGDHW